MARKSTEDVLDRAVRLAKSNRYWTRIEAAAVIEALDRSGMTIADFALYHGIKDKRLRRWKRLLSPQAAIVPRATAQAEVQDIPLVPLRVVETRLEPAAPSPIEVLLLGGRSIKVHSGFDDETLLRVVSLLEALPC